MCLHCLISETILAEARARGLARPGACETLAALAALTADVLAALPAERREPRLEAFLAGVRERARFLTLGDAPIPHLELN